MSLRTQKDDDLARRFADFVLAQVAHGLGLSDVAPESDGRVSAVAYRDPLDIAEDEDLVDDILDVDVVVRMNEKPDDELDFELHLEECVDCARMYGRLEICAHCLAERVCARVPLHEPTPAMPLSQMIETLATMPRFKELPLCRRCRNSAHNGALDVTE
jgi:hypothetical protein